jgi:hypothetical protein
LEEAGGARGGEGEDCEREGEGEECESESEQGEEQEFFEESEQEFEQVEESLSCGSARCGIACFSKRRFRRCGWTAYALAENTLSRATTGMAHNVFPRPSEGLGMEANDIWLIRHDTHYKAWSVYDSRKGYGLAQKHSLTRYIISTILDPPSDGNMPRWRLDDATAAIYLQCQGKRSSDA